MDSDETVMGFLYGCLLDAKKEIALWFDGVEDKYKFVWAIIDKWWDNKLKTPLHLVGYYLNTYFYYPNKVEIEREATFRSGLFTCVTKLVAEKGIQDKIMQYEIQIYQDGLESFRKDIAKRQKKEQNFWPYEMVVEPWNIYTTFKELGYKDFELDM